MALALALAFASTLGLTVDTGNWTTFVYRELHFGFEEWTRHHGLWEPSCIRGGKGKTVACMGLHEGRKPWEGRTTCVDPQTISSSCVVAPRTKSTEEAEEQRKQLEKLSAFRPLKILYTSLISDYPPIRAPWAGISREDQQW